MQIRLASYLQNIQNSAMVLYECLFTCALFIDSNYLQPQEVYTIYALFYKTQYTWWVFVYIATTYAVSSSSKMDTRMFGTVHKLVSHLHLQMMHVYT